MSEHQTNPDEQAAAEAFNAQSALVGHDEAEDQAYAIKNAAEDQGVSMQYITERARANQTGWHQGLKGRDAVSMNSVAFRASHHENRPYPPVTS